MENDPQPMPPSDGITDKIRGMSSKTILYVMKVTNIINACLIIALYPVGYILKLMEEFTFNTFWLFGYAVLFGGMLLVFELQCSFANNYIRENFGFLYSWVGRILFLIFLCSLCFSDSSWLAIVVGSLTLVNGLFNCFVVYSHPAFSYGGDLYKTDALGRRPGSTAGAPPPAANESYSEETYKPKATKKNKSMPPAPSVGGDNPFAVGGATANTYAASRNYNRNLPSDNPFDDV